MNFLLLLLFLIFTPAAAAAGIGVAPSAINFQLDEGESQSREITIYNLGDEEINLEISGSSNKALSFYPQSGKISGGGSLKVRVTAKEVKQQAQEYFYINAYESSSGVSLNYGAKVQANIAVSKNDRGRGVPLMLIVAGLIIVTILCMLIYLLAIVVNSLRTAKSRC